MVACGMAKLGSHRNWSQASSVRMRTATSSRKVITCEIVPLSLLLNTPLGRSSQQCLVQEAVSLTPVSSQNTLTSGETPTSHAFPFGHCQCWPCAASLTLCKVWNYALNHSELSTSPCTSSHVMNCPMFRTVGAGGQVSRPCTLILHHQTARRCLASERAMLSAPIISGATNLYQGTLSSKVPWTTNCNQCVVHQVGSTVSSISSSMLMSTQYPVHCPWLPPEHFSLPSAEDWQLLSFHCIMRWAGICWVWKSSSYASSWSSEAQAVPLPEWLDWAWGECWPPKPLWAWCWHHGMWLHCNNTSQSHRGVKLLHVGTSKVCGGMQSMNVHPKLASGSDDASHFRTSSGTGMLVFTCFAQSWGRPHGTVLLPTPDGPRNLASVAGNGLHHRGPCRCVAVARPALYTKGDCLKAWAMGPPAIHHHTLPTWGTQGGEHPPHLGGPRHLACQSFWSHSFSWCSGWQRYIVSHRPAWAFRPAFGSSWLVRRCRIIHPARIEAFWYGTCPSCCLWSIESLCWGSVSWREGCPHPSPQDSGLS